MSDFDQRQKTIQSPSPANKLQLPPTRITDEQLCDIINANYASIRMRLLTPYDVESVQNPVPNTDTLASHNIVYVDAKRGAIARIMGELMITTRGNASCILFEEEMIPTDINPLEMLCSGILALKPTAVLLDYQLSETITGVVVATLLHRADPSLKIVGCSDREEHREAFSQAGFSRFVLKKGFSEELLPKLSAQLE